MVSSVCPKCQLSVIGGGVQNGQKGFSYVEYPFGGLDYSLYQFLHMLQKQSSQM